LQRERFGVERDQHRTRREDNLSNSQFLRQLQTSHLDLNKRQFQHTQNMDRARNELPHEQIISIRTAREQAGELFPITLGQAEDTAEQAHMALENFKKLSPIEQERAGMQLAQLRRQMLSEQMNLMSTSAMGFRTIQKEAGQLWMDSELAKRTQDFGKVTEALSGQYRRLASLDFQAGTLEEGEHATDDPKRQGLLKAADQIADKLPRDKIIEGWSAANMHIMPLMAALEGTYELDRLPIWPDFVEFMKTAVNPFNTQPGGATSHREGFGTPADEVKLAQYYGLVTAMQKAVGHDPRWGTALDTATAYIQRVKSPDGRPIGRKVMALVNDTSPDELKTGLGRMLADLEQSLPPGPAQQVQILMLSGMARLANGKVDLAKQYLQSAEEIISQHNATEVAGKHTDALRAKLETMSLMDLYWKGYVSGVDETQTDEIKAPPTGSGAV